MCTGTNCTKIFFWAKPTRVERALAKIVGEERRALRRYRMVNFL